MVFFQISFQIVHIEGMGVVAGVKNRCTTVDGDKIFESFSEYPIIQNQNPVARFGQGGTGSFQTEDTFPTEDQGFVFGMQQTAVEFTGVMVIFYEATVQIWILKLSAPCQQNIFADLRRTGSHHFVHKPILSASFCN